MSSRECYVKQGLRHRCRHDEVREAGPPRAGITRTWPREAGTKALADAGIGYARGRAGLRRLRLRRLHVGPAGALRAGADRHPVFNVNNNCSTGSTALYLAAQAIRGGLADCVLALGFEKMKRGALAVAPTTTARTPMDRHVTAMAEISRLEVPAGAVDLRRRRPRAHGAIRQHRRAFRQVGSKNHKHSVQQPVRAVPGRVLARGDPGREDDLRPLTKLQCSPTSDGAAAAVLASEGSSTSTGSRAKRSRSSGRR